VARTLRSDLRLSFASRSLDKAEEYRRRFGGTRAYGSYEEACASSDVDAVFICTPHAYHLDHATLAAANRKPMLIEKPITRTLDELTRLEAVVSAADTPCMVAENYFFKPLVRTLRSHLETGDIGELLFLELNKTGRSRNTGWRTDAELMGGGALLEGGVHWVNLLLEIAGPPTEVVAARPEVEYPVAAPFEDNLQVLVRFQTGAVGKLLHSWNTLNRIAGLGISRIYGTAGNITFESNGLWALVLGRRRRFRIPGVLDIMGYRAMLRHFARSVQQGTHPHMSLAVARRDMELVFSAYRSLTTGRFEPVPGGPRVEATGPPAVED
jgi:predicted dehydrogenase